MVVRVEMSKVLAVSVLLAVLASLVGYFAEAVAVVGAEQGYARVVAVPVKGRMLGVYGRYAVGLVPTEYGTALSTVDLYTGESRALAISESIGLRPTAARFYETEDHFAVFDGRLLLVFDRDARFVGRFAGDNVKGFAVLPSGNLVVWGRDYVAFARAPGYVSVAFYDVWEQFFKIFNESAIKPEDWLTMAGVEVGAEIAKMRENLREVAKAANGVVVYEEVSIFYDIWAPTVRMARQKLDVDVASAIVLANGTGYVATKVSVPVVIRLYGVVRYSTEEGVETKEVELANSYLLSLGVLAKLWSNEVLEVYDTIDGGVPSSAMVYVYRPLIGQSLKARFVRIIRESGDITSIPIYFSGQLADAYVTERLSMLRLDTDIALIYRNQTLLWSFTASRITDVGVMPDGRMYVTYLNALGAHELGVVDFYSGRVDKVSVDIPFEAVGVNVSSDDRFIVVVVQVGDEDAELWVHASSVARLRLTFIDATGAMVSPILWGRATITSGMLRYTVSITDNPAILLVPAPSTVDVAVDVPYGRAAERIDVLKPTDQAYSVVVQIKPSPGIVDRGNVLPFTAPFYLDHVLVKDTEILRYSLPGARYLDSYGTYVLLLYEGKPGEPSKLSLYGIDGRELWSKVVSGYMTEARIFFPYVVVRGFSEVHVLDISSGATRGSVVMLVEGYDVDLDTEYLSVWNRRTIAVLDLRRGEISFVDMASHGAVLAAPIVGGSVFAYVQSGDVVNVYVVNPLTKSVVEVLPLGAQAVIRFATDGRFKAVSYTAGGNRYTSLLSSYNGVVNIPSGPTVTVRSIGRVASLPAGASTLYGNMFSVLLVSEDTAYAVYAAGMNYVKLLSLEGTSVENLAVNTLFIAERVTPVNATPTIVLRDFSGAPRVTIALSIAPAVFTASEHLVVYSDKERTYVIPNPRVIGKYLLSVRVEDAETWRPIDGTIEIKEYGTKAVAEGGLFRTFLSLPGTLTLRISAPFYVPEEVKVELTDEKPVASISVRLKPQLFTLSVRVVTVEGEEVREGNLSVFGKEPPVSITVDLSKTNRVEGLRVGRYEVLFTSDVFTTAHTVVELTSNTEIVFTVNRTAVRTFFRVLDDLGRPVERAKVVLTLERVGEIELTTDKRGETQAVLLPYRAVVNYTASARGYATRSGSFTADLTVEGRPITISIPRFKGTITIMVRDTEGNPLTASVTVKDAMGNDVLPAVPVIDTYMVDLEIGAYTIIGVAPDGRTAQTVAVISEEMPSAVALLTFEVPPQPAYVAYFPLVLAVVVASTAAVAIYRRFFRRKKPKVVV
ncbi:MAG: hypothetical protein QW067_10810 [Thermofilaceae archaeon]